MVKMGEMLDFWGEKAIIDVQKYDKCWYYLFEDKEIMLTG